jgi:hypothetical protein
VRLEAWVRPWCRQTGEDLLFFSLCDRDRAILARLVSNTVRNRRDGQDGVLLSRSAACDHTRWEGNAFGAGGWGEEDEKEEKVALRFQEKARL